jgi:multidrug transporter EmrE-like cation transporter
MEDHLRRHVSAPAPSPLQEPKSFHFSRRQSVALVFFCTVFGAAAQILIKHGANGLASGHPLAMITNLPLMAGYSLYGISTVLLVLALKDGELSVLYPVISLTYVWVMLLSLVFFKESMNLYKLLGLVIIVTGVGVLGRDGKR